MEFLQSFVTRHFAGKPVFSQATRGFSAETRTNSKPLFYKLTVIFFYLSKSVANRKRVPWFNHKIKDAIKARRRAERKWRYSKSAQDLSVFKKKKNHAIYLMNQARCDYYTNHIQQNSSDQRKLFNVTKSQSVTPTLHRFLALTLFSLPMTLEISLHKRLRI